MCRFDRAAGRAVAAFATGDVCVWAIVRRGGRVQLTPVASFPAAPGPAGASVTSAGFSPDGLLLYTSSDAGTVLLRRIADGGTFARLRPPRQTK